MPPRARDPGPRPDHLDDGRRYGVTGTPTFFIAGKIIRGAQPYAQIKAQLDAALGG